MDKKQFADMVARPAAFSAQERGWLKAMAAKYPHSSVVGVLALLADRAHHFDTPDERRRAAVAMCNPSGLDAMLDAATIKSEEVQVDILTEINTFQEPSFKTAPKSVILSNFLEAGPASDIERATARTDEAPHDDKKSIRADESLATETLAVILEKQGKFERSLAIYRKLLDANPEKSSIFAPRIARLEEAINSK